MGPPPDFDLLGALNELNLPDTISRRTRSKAPLTDTHIDTIEAGFIPPDITSDMYGTSDDNDPVWQNFLTELFKNDLPGDDEDDTEADPEYNVLAEHENCEETEEDFILPLRVSKGEIKELMEELYEAEDDDTNDIPNNPPDTFNKPRPYTLPVCELLKQSRSSHVKKVVKSVPKLPKLTDDEKGQLHRQMQIHVQLLAQIHITSPSNESQCLQFLTELERFTDRCGNKDASVFNAINLQPAIALVQNYQRHPSAIGDDTKVELTIKQKEIMSTSAVFMYPELLPPNDYKIQKRILFSHAEDMLICLGWLDFSKKWKEKVPELIAEYLTPIYTPSAVRIRIKNRLTKPSSDIYKCKRLGILPPSVVEVRNSVCNNFISPISRPPCKAYPEWLQIAPITMISTTSNTPASTGTPTANARTITASPLIFIQNTPTSVTASKTLESSLIENKAVPAEDEAAKDGTQKLEWKDGTTLTSSKNVDETTPSSSGPGMMNILSDLCCVMLGGSSVSSETSVVLLTPTKKVLTPVKNLSSERRYRELRPSTEPTTPVKQIGTLALSPRLRKSPRRAKLRTQVQNIIPKTFVPTVFVPSPTKKAAKALTVRAMKQNKFSSLGSPKKRQKIRPLEESGGNHADFGSESKENEELDALIEASTTVRSKATKKHRYLACLAPDIVESDPLREERDDAFSHWFVNKVKKRFGDNSSEYSRFLETLIEFGKQKKNPAEFYVEMKSSLLKGHDDLVLDFSGFLLPSQAISCGDQCYRACLAFYRARQFLRKLEVYFGGNTATFHKLIKILSKKSKDDNKVSGDWRRQMSQLLKAHPMLLEDFNAFLIDEAPPKRHAEDYEEVDLTDMDEEMTFDGFEEMEIPEIEETNATKKCKCTCHSNKENNEAYHQMNMHCQDCRIAVYHNRLYIHTGPRRGLKPAYIRYLDPMGSPQKHQDSDEDDDNDSDNSVDDYECPLPDACSPAKVSSPEDPRSRSPSVSSRSSLNSRQTDNCGQVWNREEDQLLLEAIRSDDTLSLTEDTFKTLISKLNHRTADQIRNRFHHLVELLSQELSEDSESCSDAENMHRV